ncbi:hypothetical protein [Lysinibacillus sp. NPDC092081]|uniref:hypothetical protein n=1 Tax=Lysinibacillus sp. NPDC092081 TaxID=3364131 RepID=UPI00382A36A2
MLLQRLNIDLHQHTEDKEQFEVLSFISNGKIEQLSLKVLEEKALYYFEQQKYYSLILFYAPLFAELYKTLLAYKQASNCYERTFMASKGSINNEQLINIRGDYIENPSKI